MDGSDRAARLKGAEQLVEPGGELIAAYLEVDEGDSYRGRPASSGGRFA